MTNINLVENVLALELYDRRVYRPVCQLFSLANDGPILRLEYQGLSMLSKNQIIMTSRERESCTFRLIDIRKGLIATTATDV